MIRVFHNFSAPATINCLSTQFPTHLRVLMQNVITEEIHREIFFRSGHYQLALHPDETHIAIFDRESMRFRLEELHPFKKLVEWPALEVARAMEFHPTGKWLMTVSYNGKVVVYDSATQDPIHEFRIASQKINRNGLKFAPNGDSFAISTGEGFVALYPFTLPQGSCSRE